MLPIGYHETKLLYMEFLALESLRHNNIYVTSNVVDDDTFNGCFKRKPSLLDKAS